MSFQGGKVYLNIAGLLSDLWQRRKEQKWKHKMTSNVYMVVLPYTLSYLIVHTKACSQINVDGARNVICPTRSGMAGKNPKYFK
jgi:hypothetical protein